MRDPMDMTRRQTPEEYAQQRANETGRPCLVTMMGHVWPVFPDNVREARKHCGGIAGIFRPKR